MVFKVGEKLTFDPFEDEEEDDIIDSPVRPEPESIGGLRVGEKVDFDPFEGEPEPEPETYDPSADPYENDPKASDSDEPDEQGHSVWDYANLLGRASAGIGKTAGMLAGLTPPELASKALGVVGDLTGNEFLQSQRDFMDKHGLSAKITQYGDTAEKYYDEKLTPAMKASMKKTILAGADEDGWFGEGLTDFFKITGMITESIPSTILSMGGGATITKGLINTGMKYAPKIVQGVLGKLIKKYGINKVAGVVGGAIGEGGYSGMENARQAYEQMMEEPDANLRKSKVYREIYESMPDALGDEKKHEYARKTLALATAGFVGSTTAVTTGVFGAPSGAFMGKLIGGEGGKSLWGNLIKGAISEGLFEEMPQSGLEQFVSNFSRKFLVDENQPLMEGVGESMASGAIAGFAMGGGMAVVAGRDGSKAKDLLTDGKDEDALDILLGKDEAEKIRQKTKGKEFGGDESIDAEEEAGEHAEEDLDELAEEPKPPKEKPKTPKPKPKLPPAPEGDRRGGKRPDADRRTEPEREPPAWDAPFRALYTRAQKEPENKWTSDAKLRVKAKDPMILDLAQRLGENIEADTDIDEALKKVYSRIKGGMQPRKKASEMTAEELKDALNTDFLTGLRNKQAFDLEDTRRAFVSSIDLDSLKYINDNFGHQTGDAMLIHFGNALKTITEADTYHVSGDEFIIQGDDSAQLDELLNKRVVDFLKKNPLTVVMPDGKKIKYTVGFSYGTAETVAQADERLARQKEERQRSGKRAGRGETPPGLPGGPTPGQRPGDRGEDVPEGQVRTLKHFTSAERAGKIQKEGFKYGAEKPLFGTGGLNKGEKTGRFAGNAIYLSLDDKAWGELNTFEASGPAVKATGKEGRADHQLYYDYENQAWMAEPGKYKKTSLQGVDFEIPPGTRVLKIDSIAAHRKVAAKYGDFGQPAFWKAIAKDFDAVEITNTAEIQKANPDYDFFKAAMADQLIVLNKDIAKVKGQTPADTDDQSKIDQELDDLEHDPTPGQAEAGNYKKGHFKFMGFRVTIENAPGDIRTGTDSDGEQWSQKMANAYGYFSRTEGKDGDEIDLFLGPLPEAQQVYIVHQVDPKTGKPDEDKVMLGFGDTTRAKAAYMANYKQGWQGFGSMTAMGKPQFADWLDQQTKDRAAAKKKKAEPPKPKTPWPKTPKPEEPVLPAEAIPATTGKKVAIITPGNKRGYSGYYALVEAADLIPSHNAETFQKNAGYPEGIQERTYHSDKQEQSKVVANAQDLNPAILLSDDPTPTNGPPVITASGIVLGGNSRTMSIQRAYSATKAAAKKAIDYKNQISLQARKFGLIPANAFDMEKPVLVRVVHVEKGDVQTLHRMATDFNQALTQGVSEEAEIASMGKNISTATIEKIGLRMANRDLTIRELLGKKDGLEIIDWLINDGAVSATDKNRYINLKVNLLNEPGKIKIEKAIFGSIIDDADLISAAPKSLQNKIGRSLPSLAKIKARGEQWDITPAVKDALELATQAKGSDISIREFLKQGSLFGDKKVYSDIARALAFNLEASTMTGWAEKVKRFAGDAMADVKNQTFLFEPKSFAQAFEDAFQAVVKEPAPPPLEKPAKVEAKTVAEQALLSPDEFINYKKARYKGDLEDSGIDFPEKVKIEETGEVIERQIDAVGYLIDIEEQLDFYEELRLCMGGRTK